MKQIFLSDRLSMKLKWSQRVAEDTIYMEEMPQIFNEAWNHLDPELQRKWHEMHEQTTGMEEDIQGSYAP